MARFERGEDQQFPRFQGRTVYFESPLLVNRFSRAHAKYLRFRQSFSQISL
jgi:hypothetical protein